MNITHPTSALTWISNALDKILVWVSIMIGSALTVNMIVAVFFRYVLNSPIFWADELSLYLFCWITFLGASLAVKRWNMPAVTFILDLLPFRPRTVILMGIQFCILMFAVVVGYNSILWIESPSVQNMISPALSVKAWKLYTIVPISMVCIVIFTLDHLARLVKQLLYGKMEELSL